MKIRRIAGICEECGFSYKGFVEGFGMVTCPHCEQETQNNDEENIIALLNSLDGNSVTYTESRFNTTV